MLLPQLAPADEIRTLRCEVEALKAVIEALQAHNELLREENQQLRQQTSHTALSWYHAGVKVGEGRRRG